MVKLVAVIGCKKSGKTRLIEELLKVFTQKGYRVGVIKNSHHTLETDRPGTDSWRLKEAGASRVMLTWPGGAALPHFAIQKSNNPRYLADLCMEDLDLVILEGFKSSPLPKILVHGSEKNFEYNPRGLFATVGAVTETLPKTDAPPGTDDIHCFEMDDTEGIAGCIEERLRWNKKSKPPDIDLRVDGTEIGLKGFVRDIVANSITGMVKTLKGCKEPGRIEITIDLEETEET